MPSIRELAAPTQESLPPGNPTPFSGKSIREADTPELRPEVQGLVRSPAMSVPEWVAHERDYAMQQARDILRNPMATEEEKGIAQARLKESE